MARGRGIVGLVPVVVVLALPCLAAALTQDASGEEKPPIKVTVLGSGSPLASKTRVNPSFLIETDDDDRFLFDCGRSCAQRLGEYFTPKNPNLNIVGASEALTETRKLFLTHLHSDHVTGIADLWIGAFALSAEKPLRVWGPTGTSEMMKDIRRAHRVDVNLRNEERGVPADSLEECGTFTDFDTKGKAVVYEDEKGVKITRFEVDHDLLPAVGYLFEYKGMTVVISGDTTESDKSMLQAVAQNGGKGVDLLLVEVLTPRFVEFVTAFEGGDDVPRVIKAHMTVEQAAGVLQNAKPVHAAYFHLADEPPLDRSLLDQTCAIYKGPLTVPNDLTQFQLFKRGVQGVPSRVKVVELGGCEECGEHTLNCAEYVPSSSPEECSSCSEASSA